MQTEPPWDCWQFKLTWKVKTMKSFNKALIADAIAILACLMFSHFSFSADLSAVELLKQSYARERQVNHTGTLHVVNIRNGKTKTTTVEIRQKEGKTRMDYKTGRFTKQSIVDDGKQVMHLSSRRRAATISMIPPSSGDISLLISNHDVILEGTETVANRPTYVVNVMSRHKGNPRKKLWIDAETFMSLKKEYYNSDGILTTQTFYTDIHYNVSVEESDFAVPEGWRIIQRRQGTQKMSSERLSETLGFDVVKPNYIPPRYVLEGFYLASDGKDEDERGAYIKYTNGLNTISVLEGSPGPAKRFLIRVRGVVMRLKRFIKRYDDRHGLEKRIEEFLGNSQVKIIQKTKGKVLVFLVGDIAKEELQRMADSL